MGGHQYPLPLAMTASRRRPEDKLPQISRRELDCTVPLGLVVWVT